MEWIASLNRAMRIASRGGSGPSRSRSPSCGPASHSIEKNARPLLSPASKKATMPGCSRFRRMAASRRTLALLRCVGTHAAHLERDQSPALGLAGLVYAGTSRPCERAQDVMSGNVIPGEDLPLFFCRYWLQAAAAPQAKHDPTSSAAGDSSHASGSRACSFSQSIHWSIGASTWLGLTIPIVQVKKKGRRWKGRTCTGSFGRIVGWSGMCVRMNEACENLHRGGTGLGREGAGGPAVRALARPGDSGPSQSHDSIRS